MIGTRRRDTIAVTLAALAVRLWWNLSVHRPLDYAYSDMGGYLERARTSIDFPNEPRGYFALFPWGTHWLLSLVMRAFGRDNGAAIGVTYAILGALAAGYGFALAQRFTRSVWTARAVGAVLVVYYPWISLGGYALSEPPFTLFLTATAFHALAYADRGRTRDAWLFGGMLAAGAVFRPQILAALPLYGLHVLFRRRAWRRLRVRTVAPAIVLPLLLVFTVSAIRDRFHTGRYGLISGNGPLNYAFGRCHALAITAVAPDRKSGYAPPSLRGLADWEAAHPGTIFRLDAAMDRNLVVQGHIWEAPPFEALSAECVRRTGLSRQAYHALVHVDLLWFHNQIWPDVGQARFIRFMAASQAAHDLLVLPGAAVALALSFRRRHARAMLLSLHVLALLGVAMVYFGDTRLRAPYDGILIVLAASAYLSAARAVLRWRYRDRQGAGQHGARSGGPAS